MPESEYKVSIVLGAKVIDYNRGVDGATKSTVRLRDAQEGTTKSSAALAAELTAAGNAARGSVNDLNSMTRAVRSLERAERKLNDERARGSGTPGPGGGGSGGGPPSPRPTPRTPRRSEKIADVIANPFKSLTDALPAEVKASVAVGLTGAAVVAAPIVAATITGAILAAVSGSALGVGIAAAISSGSVDGALNDLKADLGGLASGISSDFEDELRGGLGFLGDEIDRLGPGIRVALAPAAGYIEPLLQGFTGLVQEILPGFTAAVAASGPIFDVLAEELPYVGQALGDLFGTLAGNADEGAAALKLILITVEDTILLLSAGVDFLTGWFVNVLKIGQVLALIGESVTPDALGGEAFRNTRQELAEVQAAAEGTGPAVADAYVAIDRTAADAAGHTEAYYDRQKILNGSFREGVSAAGGFKAALDDLSGGALSAEAAEDAYQAALDASTKALKENGRTLDAGTEKGRANRETLRGIAETAQASAAATYKQVEATGTQAEAEDASTRILEAGRKQLIKKAIAFGKTRAEARAYAEQILGIPGEASTKIKADVDPALAQLRTLGIKVKELPDGSFEIDTDDAKARAALEALGFKVKKLPNGKFKIVADSAEAKSKLDKAQELINELNGRTAVITVQINEIVNRAARQQRNNPAEIRGNADGGVYTPMAAGGTAGIYPASNPPLYQFAEPQTGGEAFIPRKGISKARGRDLVATTAEWYGLTVMPRAGGGITAAANGLVNFAPREAAFTPSATRLDYAESIVQARDAVKSLNTALKENGRSFSISTQKGRENRSSVYSVIRAAQDAAKTKFDETGSVRKANAAYDAYIARLRAALKQQKVNSGTVRALLSVAQRPTYGDAPEPAAPRNSQSRIATTRSAISALGSLGDLRDALSLNRPTTNLGSVEGRGNLSSILDFLEAAAQVAQDTFAQTGNSRTANSAYRRYTNQLRRSLATNGYSKTKINQLLQAYGRITLVPNAAGGIYGGGLDKAQAFGPGETMYAFREPSTGGEAFIPRYGNQANAERVLSLAAGWRGGAYIPQQQVASGGGGYASHMTLNNYGSPMTVSKFQQVQRQADVRNRQGRAK